VGLNLTMASRVIVLDPWWNEAAEQQAFCRVYRFGQKSTTHLTRLCVKNTVDERLIEMQEKKQKEIDEVMNDKGKTVGSMGRKLIYLLVWRSFC
jgi:SNF2 family DNA or RNA helicase